MRLKHNHVEFSEKVLLLHSYNNNNNINIRPDPAHKLSTNLHDIYHCCVYSEKLLMMDRETVRNM